MLVEHFKLNVQPFGVTPDTRFLYFGHSHREALASLLYGIRSARGFTALIAPPGMGKTTLLFQVLKLLRGNAKTAFLFQTLCGTEDFLHSLLGDLGIEHASDDIARMHAKLNAYLLAESKKGHEVVVVIDEAQNLDDRVLELVRMLSNFETPGRKLMHLLLSGQLQLAEKLALDRFTQLRQRISIVARLNPLSANETKEYIEHRLRVAGASSDRPVFSSQAYEVIAEHSAGIPRNINNLCFNSMSLACALKRPQVDALMVRETINDLDLTTIAKPDVSGVQARPWSTLFGTAASPALSYRPGIALGIGLLSALAALFQPWALWKDGHAANLVRQKAANAAQPSRNSVVTPTALPAPWEGSTRIVGTSANDGRTLAPVGHSHREQASSAEGAARNWQALEKISDALKDGSVPFELTAQREKP
jgi:type II secretory pathway predicted ATPase ExeA